MCMCQYDSRVAGGEGSRVVIDLEKLTAAGWNVEKSRKSYIMDSSTREETFSFNGRSGRVFEK